MSARANHWLTWQPRQEGKTEPTKPTKPGGEGGFVGFEGRGEGPYPFIEDQTSDSGRSVDLLTGLDSPAEPTGPCLRTKRNGPRGEPTKPTKPPSPEDCEGALIFVKLAGARLVCPDCAPDCPAGAPLAILVPPENDGLFFRAALTTLGLDRLPVIPRRAPLGFRPEVEHQRKKKGVSE